MALAPRDIDRGARRAAGDTDEVRADRGSRETTTGARRSSRAPRSEGASTAAAAASGQEPALLGGVPDATRMQMELVARSSKTPDEALEPVLAILVGDDGARRAAIATAFRSHDGLRDQWERTWEILRA